MSQNQRSSKELRPRSVLRGSHSRAIQRNPPIPVSRMAGRDKLRRSSAAKTVICSRALPIRPPPLHLLREGIILDTWTGKRTVSSCTEGSSRTVSRQDTQGRNLPSSSSALPSCIHPSILRLVHSHFPILLCRLCFWPSPDGSGRNSRNRRRRELSDLSSVP